MFLINKLQINSYVGGKVLSYVISQMIHISRKLVFTARELYFLNIHWLQGVDILFALHKYPVRKAIQIFLYSLYRGGCWVKWMGNAILFSETIVFLQGERFLWMGIAQNIMYSKCVLTGTEEKVKVFIL